MILSPNCSALVSCRLIGNPPSTTLSWLDAAALPATQSPSPMVKSPPSPRLTALWWRHAIPRRFWQWEFLSLTPGLEMRALSSPSGSGARPGGDSGWTGLIRQAHDEGDRGIQPADLLRIQMTDLLSDPFSADGHGLIGHDLRSFAQTIVGMWFDRNADFRESSTGSFAP